jgi:hypothetical protein
MPNNLFNQSLSLWTRSDPEAAAAWAFANLDRLDQATLRQMAADFARTRPADAERVLASLPPERRGIWLAAMVGAIGQSNPDNAIAFVERYRGQPGYAEGLNEALRGVARTDPQRAMRLLTDAGRVPAGETLMLIAGSWVRLDPEAAGDWALGLADGDQRIRAVRAVAATWAERDTEAREWVLGLPRGAVRDAALDALLFDERSPGTAAGTLSPMLLDAYSSDSARQRGVGRAAVMIGRRDADAALLLLDAHVSDPEIRKQTEELLARPDARNIIYTEYFGAN